MAKEINTRSTNRTTLGNSIYRVNGQPLDDYCIFQTLNDSRGNPQTDATKYAQSDLAYVGQYIAVKTDSGTAQDPYKYLGYIIEDADGKLRELAYKDQIDILDFSSPSVPNTGATTATAFIDTVSQTNGKISATKKNLPIANGNTLGLVKGYDSTNNSGSDVNISNGVITVRDDSHNHTTLSNVTSISGPSADSGGRLNIGSTGELLLFAGECKEKVTFTKGTADTPNTESMRLVADHAVFIQTNMNGSDSKAYKTFTFGVDGTLTANTFNAISDMRLKENFEPLTSEKSILDLPTYKFDFINGNKNQIGCKAQDLQEICPEIVDEGSDGYLSIQESKIVYLLLEEVKKLRKEIDELKGV